MNKEQKSKFKARLRDKLMRTLGLDQRTADMAGHGPRVDSLDFYDFSTQNPDGERSGTLDFYNTDLGMVDWKKNNQKRYARVRRV